MGPLSIVLLLFGLCSPAWAEEGAEPAPAPSPVPTPAAPAPEPPLPANRAEVTTLGMEPVELPELGTAGQGSVALRNTGTEPVHIHEIALLGPLSWSRRPQLPAVVPRGELLELQLQWQEPTRVRPQLLLRGAGGVGVVDLQLGWTPLQVGPTSGELRSLPKAGIDRVIKQRAPRLRRCLHAARRRGEDSDGRLTMKFTIDKSGSASWVGVKATDFSSGSIEACVAEVFLKLSFHEPRAGGFVIVAYLLIFSMPD